MVLAYDKEALPLFSFFSFVLFYEIGQESNEFLFSRWVRKSALSVRFLIPLSRLYWAIYSFNLSSFHSPACSLYFLSSVHMVWVGFFLVLFVRIFLT